MLALLVKILPNSSYYITNLVKNIKGELLEFFNNIKKEAKERGDDIHIPDMLGYPNLMAYLKYVIYKYVKNREFL